MAQTLAIQMQPARADMLVRARQIGGACVLHAVTRAEQIVAIGQGQVGVLHLKDSIRGDRDHLYWQSLAAPSLDLCNDFNIECRRVSEANQMISGRQLIEEIVLLCQTYIQ
ncbi:hypothetical protein D3C78_1304860 [compost metagenome]